MKQQILSYDKKNDIYSSHTGRVMRRENGETPNGNQLNGKWVLRDKDGSFVDFDQYRNDLAERNDIYLDQTI